MSGIAGIAGRAGSQARLDAMLSTTPYRGQGENRCEVRQGFAFALQRSAREQSLDASPESPFFDQKTGHLVVGDVRLDDEAKLGKQLGISGSTQELLLAAYLKWGADCVRHLDGDFAFVVSGPAGTFCARDHMGVKPFYYAVRGDDFYFASEARAVAIAVRPEINRRRIADYLAYPLEHVDQTSTFYHSVFRLPPGSFLEVKDGRPILNRYWSVEDNIVDTPDNEFDIRERFSELLESAVQQRAGDEEVAISLSGGVDSSTVAAFAGLSRLHTFSLVRPEDVACEDSKFIRAFHGLPINRQSSMYPEEVKSHADGLLQQISNLGEPFDYYMISYMLVCGLASEKGFSSMLDGVEGDLVHSHSPYYPSTLLREGRLLTGAHEAVGVWKNTWDREGSLALWLASVVRQMGLPPGLRWLRGSINRKDAFEQATLIEPEFMREQRVTERLTDLQDAQYGGYPRLQEQHRRNVHHPAITVALERYNRVAAWRGIDPLHPLIDRKLLEYVHSLPWHYRVRDGWSKHLLRSAGAGRLPAEFSWRVRKDENARHFIDAFTRHAEAQIRETISDSREQLRGYIRQEKLDAPAFDDLLQIYGLLSWLQRENEL